MEKIKNDLNSLGYNGSGINTWWSDALSLLGIDVCSSAKACTSSCEPGCEDSCQSGCSDSCNKSGSSG